LNLSSEDILILACLRLNPSEEETLLIKQLLPDVNNWDYLCDNAIYNGVGPLVYKNISKIYDTGVFPEATIRKLKKSYYKTLSRNMVLYDHFRIAVNAFLKEKIPVIPLKGIFLAEEIYKDIGLRHLTDIDLLVKAENADKCRDLLIQNGYADTNRIPDNFIEKFEKHLSPLVKDGVSIELHTHIHPLNNSFCVKIEDLWRNSSENMICGTYLYILSVNDLILHLCLHLNNHFETYKVQLKMISDIVNVIDLMNNEIDWEALKKTCTDYTCYDIICENLLLINKYIEIPVPSFFYDGKISIDSDMENIFIWALQNTRDDIYLRQQGLKMRRNIINLKGVKGLRKKIIYLFGDIFPSRSFMYQNYRIKNKSKVYWYYVLRIFIGFYKLACYFWDRIFHRSNKK
jgi:hypothetical protein